MFEICIDENDYYTEGNEGKLVKVETIPDVPDLRLLRSYKFEDGILQKDENKYARISAEIGNESVNPSNQERLEVIESAIIELAGMLGGGQNG